jgi:hypothetical protein
MGVADLVLAQASPTELVHQVTTRQTVVDHPRSAAQRPGREATMLALGRHDR